MTFPNTLPMYDRGLLKEFLSFEMPFATVKPSILYETASDDPSCVKPMQLDNFDDLPNLLITAAHETTAGRAPFLLNVQWHDRLKNDHAIDYKNAAYLLSIQIETRLQEMEYSLNGKQQQLIENLIALSVPTAKSVKTQTVWRGLHRRSRRSDDRQGDIQINFGNQVMFYASPFRWAIPEPTFRDMTGTMTLLGEDHFFLFTHPLADMCQHFYPFILERLLREEMHSAFPFVQHLNMLEAIELNTCA